MSDFVSLFLLLALAVAPFIGAFLLIGSPRLAAWVKRYIEERDGQ